MKTLSLVAVAALALLKITPSFAGNILTITAGTETNVSAGPIFTTTGDSAVLTPASITSLWSGENVSIATGTSGANSQVGDITIQQAIDTPTTFDLLIHAANNLAVSTGGIASHGVGGITLEAGGGISLTPTVETVGGAITLRAAGGTGIVVNGTVASSSNGTAALGDRAGNVLIEALTGGVDTFGATVEAGGVNGSAAHAGDITLMAGGKVRTGDVFAFSDGQGGSVTMTAGTSVEALATYVDVSAFGTTGNAGSITLTAQGMGVTDGISTAASLLATSFAGDGGAITLTAAGGAGIVVGSPIYTGSRGSPGLGFHSGDITLTATAGDVNASAATIASNGGGVVNYSEANAGGISIHAGGGIQTAELWAFSNEGNGGAVVLGATDAVVVSTVAIGGVDVSAFGLTGDAGSILIESTGTGLTDGISLQSDLFALSAGGHGGAITLKAAGGAGIAVTGQILSGSRGSPGLGFHSGDIALTATAGDVNASAATIASNGGGVVNYSEANAGGISIHAGGGIQTAELWAFSNEGNGGDVVLSATGAVVVSTVAIGGVDVSAFGLTGDAGSILIESTGTGLMDGITMESDLFATSAGGHGGAITLTAAGGFGIAANRILNTTGALSSGDITLDAPKVFVGSIVTGGSAVHISGQEVTLGDVHAEGTLRIQPQAGCTSMILQITGVVTGDAEWDLDFGSTGSFTVASGATLGGSGTIDGDTTILGTLAPGNSPGTLIFTGDLDIAAAEQFVFELGVPASDQVVLTAGHLSIGSLGLDDFTFAEAAGFAGGEYVLFDTSNAIVGSLDPAQFTGTVFGYAAELKFTDSGRDITLAIAPEPAGGVLFATGFGLMLGTRRRRAKAAR